MRSVLRWGLLMVGVGAVCTANAHGQHADKGSRGFIVRPDSAHKFYLHYPKASRREPALLDSLLKGRSVYDRFLLLHGIDLALNTHFVNDTLGFIYGHCIQYGYVNQVHRTTDGGQTWRLATMAGSKEPGPLVSYHGTPFIPGFLHMFDTRRGFAIDCFTRKPNDHAIHYLVTSDGGMTWERRSFSTGKKDYRVEDRDTKISYAEDGRIDIKLTLRYNKAKKRPKPTDLIYTAPPVYVSLQSDDFGMSFREVE